MRLAFVIPAWNEAESIATTIHKIKHYGKPIVVDDGSTDDTSTLAEKAGAIVVRHDHNLYYDKALNTGFKTAFHLGFTHVITFDADGQHPAESIPDFIEAFSKGFDLVLGIRPKTQRVSEKIFAIYSSIFYNIHDPLCGMKGYNLNLYNLWGFFDSYGSTGTELALRSLLVGANFCEISIPVQPRQHGPSRFGSKIKGNLKILKSLYKSFLLYFEVKYRKHSLQIKLIESYKDKNRE